MEVKLRTAKSLVRRLSCSTTFGDDRAAAAAVAELRLISKHDPDIRVPLAEAGAVTLLVSYLSSPSRSSEDAAAALLNLSISARESLMSNPGLLDALATTMRSTDSAASRHAAATVHSLLCVDSYRPIIGAKRPLLAALVGLLRAAPSTRSTKDALKALYSVALYPLNRATLVELGAVPALFSLVVKDGRGGIVEDATAVISQVAGCVESVAAFRKVSGVRILVDLVDPEMAISTERARENAAVAMLNLVLAGGERASAEVRGVGGAIEAVRVLAEDDQASARGKAKAEALLRALESVGGGGTRREYCLADFLNGDVPSETQFSQAASASQPSLPSQE